MHFLAYVCLPIEQAKTSLQARRRVCKYLEREHFVRRGRFCGHCDYFSVGGRYSGMLQLLRLKHKQSRKFNHFLREYKVTQNARAAIKLFGKSFSDYEGITPVGRDDVDFYGQADDAQIMDEVLFHELKGGFDEDVTYAVAFEKPNVIVTDLDESEWREDGETVAALGGNRRLPRLATVQFKSRSRRTRGSL